MKRSGNNFAPGNSEKKPRYNEDLWSDSDSDMDEFLLRASQVCDNIETNAEKNVLQLENESIVTYNAFNRTSIMASTQCTSRFIPSANIGPTPAIFATSSMSSNYNADTNHARIGKLQQELETLKETLIAKEGEVSILRCQLVQTKEQSDQLNAKRMEETFTLLENIAKERDKATTELDFKKVEVSNLKRKLSAVARSVTSNEDSLRHSDPEMFQSLHLEKSKQSDVIVPIAALKYPLKSVIPITFFKSNADDRFPKHSIAKRSTGDRYLNSLMFPNLNGQQEKCVFTYIAHGETLRVKHFFPPICYLIESNDMQLQSDMNCVNQIYLMAFQFLHNHFQYLTEFAKKIHKQEIRAFDKAFVRSRNRRKLLTNFSPLDPLSYDSDVEEVAIQCRQSIFLLAVIYPYNSYLQDLIKHSKHPQTTIPEKLGWCYNFNDLLVVGKELNLLKILLNIVSLIQQTRKSESYAGLLCSICSLLSEVVHSGGLNPPTFELIGILTKEIIMTVPPFLVLYHLSEFLKRCVNCNEFVENLCSKPNSPSLMRNEKRNILWISNRCCTIEIYFNICKEMVTYLFYKEKHDDFRIHLNLLQFVMNVVESDAKWLQLTVQCDCLQECYMLTLEILYLISSNYELILQQNRQIAREIKTIMKWCPEVFETLGSVEINDKYDLILKFCELRFDELRIKNDFRDYDYEFQYAQDDLNIDSEAINWNLLDSLNLVDSI